MAYSTAARAGAAIERLAGARVSGTEFQWSGGARRNAQSRANRPVPADCLAGTTNVSPHSRRPGPMPSLKRGTTPSALSLVALFP